MQCDLDVSLLLTVILALGVSAKAMADEPLPVQPEVEIAQVDGDCGASAPQLLTLPGEGYQLKFDSLEAAATADTDGRDKKFCHLRLKVNTPVGFQVQRVAFEVAGAAEVAQGARANVLVRYFANGEPGADLYRKFGPDTGTGDYTAPADQATPVWASCSESPLLDVLFTLTARSASGDNTLTGKVKVAQLTVPTLVYRRCPLPH